jgi:hypothetical protein
MILLRLGFRFILCVLVAGCGIKAGRFEMPPGNYIDRDEFPWRVGVITEKTFTPYKIKFRYWSTTPFSWSLDGLQVGRGISPERHDLVAKMSVDRLDFDGGNTQFSSDKAALTMTFSVAQPDGSEVFRTTISATSSGHSLVNPCRVYCKPNPRAVFPQAFRDVFEELSKQLRVAEIKLVAEQRP